MKKVLAIAPYAYLPWHSGGQKFIGQFLQHLGERLELVVISVPENKEEYAKNYQLLPLLRSARSRYTDSSLTKTISSFITRNDIDTVIWEHPYYAWLAYRIRKRTGVQTIIHTHNIEYQRFRSMGKPWWFFLKYYERSALRKADGIFFISPDDKRFAIHAWKVDPRKCIDLPFGIDQDQNPADRMECRNEIARLHGIGDQEKILFFNGLLNYKPNLDALDVILNQVNPFLLANKTFQYKILVCGKDLPDSWNALKDHIGKNVIYAGFTNEIDKYCKASDLLLNPVLSGGGVKTKMVEAIGYGTTVISSATGSIGIDRTVCGKKLVVVADQDWQGFANAIMSDDSASMPTPKEYYDKYNWQKVIQNMLQSADHLPR